MKQIYTYLCFASIFFFASQKSIAQCACSNGDPIDSIKQTVNLVGILPFTSVVPVNRMDPSIGTLSCVVTRTRVFTVVSIEIVNRDSTDRVTYQYNYTRTTSLTGPGISISASSPRVYGPFELGQAGVDPDTVALFGPDTMFNNIVMRRQTSSSLGSYVGTGTVNFTYNNSAISGFVIGNSNNQTTIADYSDVTIEVVYYFCPLIILANQVKNFTLSRTNDGVSLSWLNEIEENGISYEVETSNDGRNFRSIGKLNGKGKGKQQYNFEHKLNSNAQGKNYFRLKITDADGKTAYSSVKTITLGENGQFSPSVYPNPVVNEVNIQLGAPQTGTITAELVGLNGQVLQARQLKANKLTNLQFTLNRKYPGGAYFLRVRNAETGNQAVTRLYIQ